MTAGRWRWLLALLALAGFGLRVYQLDGQSMWSDEGLSLYRAAQPVARILANVITVDGVDTRDANPPLYFLLLAGWWQLAGASIFGLRLLGAAAAGLAVPLIAQMGAWLFGRRVGLLAAGLLALSPFHVWQSQVLRNYGLLLTLN
ncbi:MAG: glycosyltransferase family 39 protein, partial [Candidatus Promineifilaceae bacterium]